MPPPRAPTCLSIISSCLSTLPQRRVSRWTYLVSNRDDKDLQTGDVCGGWGFKLDGCLQVDILKFSVSVSSEKSYSNTLCRWGVFLRGSTRWWWSMTSLKGFLNINTWVSGWIGNSSLISYEHNCYQAGYLYRNRATLLLFWRKQTIEAVFSSVQDYGDVIYRYASASALTPLDWVCQSTLRSITDHCYSIHHFILYEKVGWAPLTVRRHSRWSLFLSFFKKPWRATCHHTSALLLFSTYIHKHEVHFFNLHWGECKQQQDDDNMICIFTLKVWHQVRIRIPLLDLQTGMLLVVGGLIQISIVSIPRWVLISDRY